MSIRTLEVQDLLKQETLAKIVTERWDAYNSQRQSWLEDIRERRNYIFATDTSTTTNNALPWKNKTTLPKLAQIRDNLHANYLSALFPNDEWLRWEGYSLDDEVQQKREAIQSYMSNKTRISPFRSTVSQLLYDYIDWGNVFATVEWVDEAKIDPETEEVIPGYVGPRLMRISPLDIVFDPTAASFEDTWKITRSIRHFGELRKEAIGNPHFEEILRIASEIRGAASAFTVDDFRKAEGFSVDGFGDLQEYYGSGYVEILEFEGTMHDPDSGDLLDDCVITVIDRQHVVRKAPIPAWKRNGYKVHVGWRMRPDNIYAMGPLDNLVGLQYRLDHLENLKADIFDLIAAPPLKIIGDVDEFEWAPFAEIHIGEGGDVQPLAPAAQALTANVEIAQILQLMEEFAGAPRQAMGIRTPGEKTAFEVQSLENAAGRIFQEKITHFEVELLERCLNNMLELARRNMKGADVVRVMDNDIGVAQFLNITKEDITAKGHLRPIGARHFAARAQLIQNLSGITSSGVWPKIERHFSDKALAKLVEDSFQLKRFEVVSDNISLFEKAEAQRLVNQMAEDLAVEQATPLEGGEPQPV
jgi:hypothetical protein